VVLASEAFEADGLIGSPGVVVFTVERSTLGFTGETLVTCSVVGSTSIQTISKTLQSALFRSRKKVGSGIEVLTVSVVSGVDDVVTRFKALENGKMYRGLQHTYSNNLNDLPKVLIGIDHCGKHAI